MADCTWLESFKSLHFYNMEIVHVIAVFLVAYLIKRYWYQNMSYILILAIVTVLSLIVHYLTGMPTMLGYVIGIFNKPRHCN